MPEKSEPIRVNEFLFKVFNPDNSISYVPNELSLLRNSLRYTKLLTKEEIKNEELYARKVRGIRMKILILFLVVLLLFISKKTSFAKYWEVNSPQYCNYTKDGNRIWKVQTLTKDGWVWKN